MVQEGVVQAAVGQFDTQRDMLMFSPTKDRVRTLFAAEGYYTNGTFQHDNRYLRDNLLGKMTTSLTGRDGLSLTGTFHKAQWNASGEIPLRAVQDGWIARPVRCHESLRRGQDAPQHRQAELPLRYDIGRSVFCQCV